MHPAYQICAEVLARRFVIWALWEAALTAFKINEHTTTFYNRRSFAFAVQVNISVVELSISACVFVTPTVENERVILDLTLIEDNAIFHNGAAARELMEGWQWPNGPVCPLCKKREFVKVLGGKSMGEGWYHCRDCRKKFTVRLGTMFERSRIPLHKWLSFMDLCNKLGRNETYKIHKELGVTYKSVQLMVRRINRYQPWEGVWWEGRK